MIRPNHPNRPSPPLNDPRRLGEAVSRGVTWRGQVGKMKFCQISCNLLITHISLAGTFGAKVDGLTALPPPLPSFVPTRKRPATPLSACLRRGFPQLHTPAGPILHALRLGTESPRTDSPFHPESNPRKRKNAPEGAFFHKVARRRLSASRTGSCGGPCDGHTSCARPRANRGSGSRRPSAAHAGTARAVAAPG